MSPIWSNFRFSTFIEGIEENIFSLDLICAVEIRDEMLDGYHRLAKFRVFSAIFSLVNIWTTIWIRNRILVECASNQDQSHIFLLSYFHLQVNVRSEFWL